MRRMMESATHANPSSPLFRWDGVYEREVWRLGGDRGGFGGRTNLRTCNKMDYALDRASRMPQVSSLMDDFWGQQASEKPAAQGGHFAWAALPGITATPPP